MRLLLVEDDELFRLGLRVRLEQEPDLVVVAEATDGETAVARVRELAIDAVVLDLGLPGLGGLEAARQIRALQAQLPILALTSHTEPATIARLIGLGVRGYCVKGLAAETLVLALRSIAAGASWWDGLATAQIHAHWQSDRKASDLREDLREDLTERQSRAAPTLQAGPGLAESQQALAALTQREREILTLMTAGKSNQEIAQDLYISTGTVRVHVHAILQKLGARDRTQAVVLALGARGGDRLA